MHNMMYTHSGFPHFFFTGEYRQNRCPSTNTSCVPCADRLPSCVGLPNGQNSFAGQIWSPYYVDCVDNRTYTVHYCRHGWFHPVQRICVTQIHPGLTLSKHCFPLKVVVYIVYDDCKQGYFSMSCI